MNTFFTQACAFCENTYTAYRSTSVFCSDRCRMAAARERARIASDLLARLAAAVADRAEPGVLDALVREARRLQTAA